MHTLRGVALCLLIAASSLKTSAQSRQTVNQFADWFSLSSTMKFSNRFSVFGDLQFRFVDFSEAMQHQVRVGGDFKVSNQFFVMPVGYVYIWNYIYGKQPAAVINDEHRIFQQFLFRHKVKSSIFAHRLRTEERFLQAHHKDSNGDIVDDGFDNNIQYRIRYRLAATIPLKKQQDQAAFAMDPKSLYLFIYDEIFMSWGERVTYHEPDQNRVFIGLGYQFTKDFTIQSGFFWQALVKANGAQQENNIGVGTWFTYNLDFMKK